MGERTLEVVKAVNSINERTRGKAMGNVRELLSSRMGPTTVKFDTGRGGTPELTTQDIAAALAYVQQGLGRELLEALWWPESAARRRDQLRQGVIALVAPEFNRQQFALSTARTEFGIAKASMGWGGSTVTDVQRRELRRTEVALEAARADTWPNNTMEQLGVLAGAVFSEMASACTCKKCDGDRTQPHPHGSGVMKCEECSGSGFEPLSGRKRAAAIGADCSAYSRFWQPVYTWMLRRMQALEEGAAAEFRRALTRAA
ncbi:hypothetical protein [Stenotrophomonas sp.]|uniref:hypothetical protein n=1 Tax=Stenotrophomonas sp. TaxID=69392 RepID=UPI00289DEE97|nr:hypothetical protein [Stenotrophomonas sp.]